eukprot:2167329-Amphidinium_carterae.1
MALADKGKDSTRYKSERQKDISSKGTTSYAGSGERTGALAPTPQVATEGRTTAMQHVHETPLDEMPLTHLLHARVCSVASHGVHHGAPQMLCSETESMDSYDSAQGRGHCHRHVIERAQRRKRRKQEEALR